jgi:hypothetical protein
MGDLHLTLRDPSSIEESPVPESFEYPIRTLGRKVPQARVSGGDRNSSSQGIDAIKQMFGGPSQPSTGVAPMMPPAQLPPPGMGTGATEPAQAQSEVTVIRGTEKTRVIVPQR